MGKGPYLRPLQASKLMDALCFVYPVIEQPLHMETRELPTSTKC
jgi:hypothetical protein